MTAERVGVILAGTDGSDSGEEVVVGEMIARRFNETAVERNLVERQVAVLQHIEDSVEGFVAVGCLGEETLEGEPVGLGLVFAGAVLRGDEHVRQGLAGGAVLLLGGLSLGLDVSLLDMHDFVGEDEGQLALILQLRQQAGVDDHHPVLVGGGVHVGRAQHVKAQLPPKFRIGFEKPLGHRLHICVHRGAEEQLAAGKKRVIGGLVLLDFLPAVADKVGGHVTRADGRMVVGRKLRNRLCHQDTAGCYHHAECKETPHNYSFKSKDSTPYPCFPFV